MFGASSSANVAGGSSRPSGNRPATWRPVRAMCPVRAVSSGASCASSAPSRYTVPLWNSSASTSSAGRGGPSGSGTVTPVASITGPVTGCPAARAAPGSCSHINAGRIDCVIEVRVRSFVLTKCSSSCPNPSASGLASSISRTLL